MHSTSAQLGYTVPFTLDVLEKEHQKHWTGYITL